MSFKKNGYAGKILRIDLTTSKFSAESTEKYASKFLGGRGINQKILLEELKPEVTPFEPANMICFGAGALVGTPVPGAARLSIDSKNVFTNGIGSANAGGGFAVELKFAGYDHLIIQGKAREPVYLWIEDDKISFRPAKEIWGRRTSETEKMIQDDLGQKEIQVLCIGPAGKNITKSACIIVSGSRIAARCGLGAIMGSKNLKAIAVKGREGIEVNKSAEFMALVKTISQRLQQLKPAQTRSKYGTLVVSSFFNDLSALCYKNFQDDHIPEESLSKISHETFHHLYETDRYACTSCPVPCGHVYFIRQGPYSGTGCFKVEGNSVWNFGGKLAMEDSAAILKAQEECCQLGLDIDNASGAIAWAIDCFQNGILSQKDTDGLTLNWGDHKVILELLRKMAFRDGFGNILAEGSWRASRMIGRGSERYSFHLKGQDLIEGIRSLKGWALGVVVSARGGAHTRGAPTTEVRKYSPEESQQLFGIQTAGDPRSYAGKPQLVHYFENIHSLLDSLGICFFTGNWSTPDGINPQELAHLYSLATGIEVSESELLKIGERIHNVEKIFNVIHAGFTRKDDYPPEMFMKEPVKSGPLKGELLQRSEWDKMLDEYYDLHGWDRETSFPKRETLAEAGLGTVADDLDKIGKLR